MKISLFWEIKTCSAVKVNRHFGGTYLHVQGGRVRLARNQQGAGSKHSLNLCSSLAARHQVSCLYRAMPTNYKFLDSREAEKICGRECQQSFPEFDMLLILL
jgi:hypothetical protein